MEKTIKINQEDNVAVALFNLEKGSSLLGGTTAAEDIKSGHKIALCQIKAGDYVVKYGCPIGKATEDIGKGCWIHTHNMKTNISENDEYTYNPSFTELAAAEAATFNGFMRPDGKAAVRNEIWIIPLVGCVNSVCHKLAADNSHLVSGSLEGIYSFGHPYGCSQMGDDHVRTRKLLGALAHHPNAAGVLVVGLGCENLTMEQYIHELGEYDRNRIKFLVCQNEEDEYAKGRELLGKLAGHAKAFGRRPIPASKLVVGMKCGGSDGFSGITANPVVGRFSDILIAQGGSTVLTEVPEMFGAETLLMNRCINKEVFGKMASMIKDFKDYYVARGQVVYENPSPGNKEGGISTLEDKSCGCIQKGGRASVVDVIGYGEHVKIPGLTVLSGPGNDLVSATALTAAGAHMVLFTTGRGTPFGAPAPTVKISSNTELFRRKKNWMDFDAGAVVSENKSLDTVGQQLFDYIINVASGEKTATERDNFREIAIFKDGVTL